MDGGLDAQTIRLEGNIVRRTAGVRCIIPRYAKPEWIGACIEEPFSGQFPSVKARFPILGAAVHTCELAGLLRPAIDLGRLKILAARSAKTKHAWLCFRRAAPITAVSVSPALLGKVAKEVWQLDRKLSKPGILFEQQPDIIGSLRPRFTSPKSVDFV